MVTDDYDEDEDEDDVAGSRSFVFDPRSTCYQPPRHPKFLVPTNSRNCNHTAQQKTIFISLIWAHSSDLVRCQLFEQHLE
jgi:hypothetical protein